VRLLGVALVLAAALLRAWDLDHMSIWQDEGLSLFRATRDLAYILGGQIHLGSFPTQDVQPPLYFLLLAGWFKLVGVSTWAAKWLSLLASLPTVPLLGCLGRRWVGRRVGWLAAALAALSPAYLWYSQEIRSYSLAVTLGLLGVYSLARALDAGPGEAGRWRWALASGLANGLLLWTHYLGFFVVLFQALWLAVAAWRGRQRWVLALLGLLALAALPLVPFAWARLQVGRERDQVFHPLWDVLLTLVGSLGMGRTLRAELVPLATLLVAALLAGGLAWLWRRRRPAAWLTLGYLLLPTLGFFLLTFVKPAFRGVQHLLLQSPPFYLLLAAGLVAAWRRRPALGAGAALALGLLLLLADLGFYREPAFAKDDLRGLARYVDERAVPGDILAVSDPVLALAFEALVDRVEVRAVPALGADGRPEDREPAELLGPLLAGRRRLWFMTPRDDLAAWLEERALKVDEVGFHGSDIPVRLEAYERRPAGPADMPPRAEVDAILGGLRPLGFQALPEPLRAGQAARVRLAWLVFDRNLGPRKVSLRLLDEAGRVFGQSDAELPAGTWEHGGVTVWPQDLAVSPGAPPGRYRLAATVYDPETGDTWPEEGPQDLGMLRVERPTEPIPAASVVVGRRLGATGGGLRLFGADLPETAGLAGERLPLAVWLEVMSGTGADASDDTTPTSDAGIDATADVTTAVPPPDTRPAAATAATAAAPAVTALRAELVDALGRVAAAVEAPVAAPEAPLAAGDLRRLPLALHLPADAGRYGLRVRALDGAGRTVTLWRGALPVRAVALGPVDVRAPDRRTDVPAMAHRLDAAVGDSARLLGYDLPVTRVTAGQPLTTTLYWRAEARTPTAYQVTVQLVPADPAAEQAAGSPVAQHDGVPAAGERPTTGWAPGEVVTDPHALGVPADVAPGAYLLIAALYDPARPGSPRPMVDQGGRARDYVVLQPIHVDAAPATR
jgi:hypothetical protein